MAKQKLKKNKAKIFFFEVVCFVINAFIIYSLYNTWSEIEDKKKEKTFQKDNLVSLKEQNEELKVKLNKFKDSSYLAREAREKIFYSEADEYIIKIK